MKLNFAIIILSLCLRVSYAQRNKSEFVSLVQNVNKANIPYDSLVYYIPEKLIDLNNTSNKISSLNIYISKILYDLQEPLLYNIYDSLETYRFTWIRSKDYPIVFKISKSLKNKYELTTKILNTNSRYLKGKIVFDTTLIINEKQWNSFKKKITKSYFWKLSTKQDEIISDGSIWSFEGSTISEYNAIIRWSPRKGMIKDLGKYLIYLSQIKIKDSEIY